MVRNAGIEGKPLIVFYGANQAPPAPRFGPANDNGPKEPVKTVTIRRHLEQSGVAVKIKVPVDEFIGVAVSTSISEEGVLSSAIELVHADFRAELPRLRRSWEFERCGRMAELG